MQVGERLAKSTRASVVGKRARPLITELENNSHIKMMCKTEKEILGLKAYSVLVLCYFLDLVLSAFRTKPSCQSQKSQ